MQILPLLLLFTACQNECVHMCQRMDRWLNECGYSWEAKFEEEGWDSIDDCYDDHWEADDSAERSCTRKAKKWDRESCY